MPITYNEMDVLQENKNNFFYLLLHYFTYILK